MDPRKFSLFQTYDKPRGKGGSGSFATFLIIGPVCFFLGAIYSSFPYDFPLLWTSTPTSPEFYNQLETHLKLLYHSPPVVVRIGQIVAAVGFIGFFTKLFKPSEANLLFDGASLGLYMVALIVFISNTVKGFRIVDIGTYEAPPDTPDGAAILTREDSLKVLAASNTILALVLVGVLVLQAGQWYAEKREEQEVEKFEAEEKSEKKAVAKTGRETRSASGKKKQ